jgi:hypothetical protein
MKFGSLKRNYESVAKYAAKDNIESKQVKEVIDGLKRQVEEYKVKNGALTADNKTLKETADNMTGRYKDAQKAFEKSE